MVRFLVPAPASRFGAAMASARLQLPRNSFPRTLHAFLRCEHQANTQFRNCLKASKAIIASLGALARRRLRKRLVRQGHRLAAARAGRAGSVARDGQPRTGPAALRSSGHGRATGRYAGCASNRRGTGSTPHLRVALPSVESDCAHETVSLLLLPLLLPGVLLVPVLMLAPPSTPTRQFSFSRYRQSLASFLAR